MEVNSIIAEIDAQIQKLTEARRILQGVAASSPAVKAGRGRPKGSKKSAAASTATKTTTGKRRLSPEGRKRIAEAMKRRWAERRKSAAAK